MLVKVNHPFIEFESKDIEQSIASRFEDQVRQYPDRFAIKSKTGRLSYSELNRIANRVAHTILNFTNGKEVRVAILLDHDTPVIAALLGVLKAGCVCVPIDVIHPPVRIDSMLEDSQPEIVITNNQNLEIARGFVRDVRWWINMDLLEAPVSDTNPELRIQPGALSFLLYTSGTTGQPKGVMQVHRNGLRNARGYINGFHFSVEDRIALLASSSTGHGIVTVFSTLLCGATLCPYNIREKGMEGLNNFLSQERITIFIAASTVFRHFVRTLNGSEEFPDLRLIRLGSEPVIKKDFELYQKHFANCPILVNTLSSTETGNTTQYFMDKDSEITRDVVPIGYPVDFFKILLLNDRGEDVGFDSPGQIAIVSRYLSPGYWRKPELTKEVFHSLPDSEERIYFTGDLGRRHPDGYLEHAGRKDFQVKIRGFRIEVEEIESRLSKHPAIHAAAIRTNKEEEEKRLIAYIVPQHSQNPTVREMVNHIKEALPDHMIPSEFIIVDALPMTPNGKVDREALSRVQGWPAALGHPYVAPRNSVEEKLLDIWTGVLRRKQIGIQDSFFELGGHSLTATQVLSRIRAHFSTEIPVREFFAQPTISALAERIGQNTKTEIPAISPASRDRDLPLSFGQQRLWFLYELEKESSHYNIARASRILGSLNITVLEQALTEIVRRHESLRTSFPSENGIPRQYIAPPTAIKIKQIDLRTLPESEREVEAQRWIDREIIAVFDLSRDVLLKGTLLRLGDEEHLLLLVVHQLAVDGWSMGVLLKEFAAIYSAFVMGEASPLHELRIQYSDFAVWQRQWLQGETAQKQLSYWMQKLADSPPIIELPSDYFRPSKITNRGSSFTFSLSNRLTALLTELARKEGATVFMTLLAGFKTFLSRYTRIEDVSVGSFIANRSHLEVEEIIGFFVNTLVMRTDLSGNPSFRELLHRVRETTLEAYEYQEVPFERLLEELNPERSLAHTPLFQVSFLLQNAPRPSVALPNLTLTFLDIERRRSHYDLSLMVWERTEGIRMTANYRTDLFDRSTIVRMMQHFENLLEGIVANPNQRLAELPLSSEAERHQLLVEWNDTRVDFDEGVSLHQLFEAQVEKTPEAVALVFEEQQMTYRELNARANQLANRLRTWGVGPEVLVGLCMEPSIEIIIGLLGILKAGGGYVPLNPGYPKARLTFMLEDTKAQVLLTQEHLIKRLPESNIRILSLDKGWMALESESEANVHSGVNTNNTAYVIYTSGSTGQPKGVVIPHQAIRNRLLWGKRAYQLSESDRVLQAFSFSFDFSVWEVFTAFLTGASLIIAPAGKSQDPASLIQLITSQKITVAGFVPSMLQALLNESAVVRCVSLKKVFCGGESLPVELQQRFFDLFEAELQNTYGPTEASIDVTYFICKRDANHRSVPLGRPISNIQIYILDADLQPVPVGVFGELHISGVGLARGYLNRPELTAERFIPNPFSAVAGSRLYKTGDLVRYLPDGNIEYLGRSDHQVKIRGFRIELGETEAVLKEHPGVREAIVAIKNDQMGEKRLVAYVVARHRNEPTPEELRSFSEKKLPDYMIPSNFVRLDVLPLTSGQKVDRRALPDPDWSRSALQIIFVAPRSPLEQTVVQIWTEVLKVDRIGIHDNFFHLGGHSLLATQVISRMNHTFQVEVPLRSLFENPTVGGLAEIVLKQRNEVAWDEEMLRKLSESEGLSDEEKERLLSDQMSRKDTKR